MLIYYTLAIKPGWCFLEGKIKDRVYMGMEVQSSQVNLKLFERWN